MKNKVSTVLSYVLTALLACAVTTFLLLGNRLEGYSKLEQLELLIEKEFIGEVDQTKLEDAAAGGMISALGDRWSYYIPADQYAQHQEQMKNSYVGIGVTVRQLADGTGLEVLEATEGSPAQEAGIQPGDMIVAVEGEQHIGCVQPDSGRRGHFGYPDASPGGGRVGPVRNPQNLPNPRGDCHIAGGWHGTHYHRKLQRAMCGRNHRRHRKSDESGSNQTDF